MKDVTRPPLGSITFVYDRDGRYSNGGTIYEINGVRYLNVTQGGNYANNYMLTQYWKQTFGTNSVRVPSLKGEAIFGMSPNVGKTPTSVTKLQSRARTITAEGDSVTSTHEVGMEKRFKNGQTSIENPDVDNTYTILEKGFDH